MSSAKKSLLLSAFECERPSASKIRSLIIEAGADVNFKNNQGKTALMYAVQLNVSSSILKLLINHGANVDECDKWKRTPLMYTTCIRCQKNFCTNKKSVLILLNNGANASHRDFAGNTILHLEICSYLISLFIQYGVPIEAKDNAGDTPLMLHSLRNNRNKVHTLLSLGADPNCLDANSNTPIFYSSDPDIINNLIYYGADLDIMNESHENVFTAYLKRGWMDSLLTIVKNLLLLKGDISHLFFVESSFFYYKSKVDGIKLEMEKMKITNMTNELTFYEFCSKKKTRFSKFVNISKDQYFYTSDQIRKLFPLYHRIIEIRINYNEIDKCKIDMLKKLEKVVFKPFAFKDDPLCIALDYDCLFLVGRFLSIRELYNLLCASV